MNKDYYKILDIHHTANQQEIKKAYRQLAMKFHPDRNEGDPLAENHFKEVQEAYEILSHPGRRSAYNQLRWYRYSNHRQYDNLPITSYSILHKCKALNRYISTLAGFDINKFALNNYILQLLSESSLKLLIKENDKSSNEFIIKELLKSTYPLPLKSIKNIATLLLRLAGDDRQTIEVINKYLKYKKNSFYWSQYQPVIVLIISILLCLLIYYVSNSSH